MTISAKTYEQVALEDGDDQWELVCGGLRKKPGMTVEHNSAARRLAGLLFSQLDSGRFVVDLNAARLRVQGGSYYVPDLCVIPLAAVRRLVATHPRGLEVYDEPLPLVVEVWSPSTGEYDVEVKLREYQQRGDAEIWRVHPYERTLTAWRRQPDGSYSESVHRDGAVAPAALPEVAIDLAALFTI